MDTQQQPTVDIKHDPALATQQGSTVATARAPVMAQQPNSQDDDVQDWINRFKAVANKPDTVTAPAPASASPWHERLFGCFDPIDTCAITCCCPCVTFGKTHHRLRKDPTMAGYSPVNASCIGWWGASCFGLHWAFQLLQRHEIRERNGLTGEIVTDCLRAWCCSCCDLIQQDKEAAYHALANTEMTISEQPQKQDAMVYQG